MAVRPYSPASDGSFPSPILPREELNKPETGLQVARAIYDTSVFGQNSYYTVRNNMFAERRVFAQGKQPISTYLDLLGVDGKNAYANFSYHPRPIAPKFRTMLVNDIMERMENVDCTGLSQSIQKRKSDKKTEMAFRMEHGDFLKAAEQSAGMKFSDSGEQFTPENDEELDLWAEINNKEKEEELMSVGIDFILYNNDWNSIKKEVSEDLVDTGMGCTRTYFDSRKRIRIERIRPEYLVYGADESLDMRKSPYFCHLSRLPISTVRALYPKYPEQKLYELAYQFRGLYGNPDQLVDFIIDFDLAYTRPYDSWLIDVLFFRYKVNKPIKYSKGQDIYDNNIVEWREVKDNPKKENYQETIPTWYDGAWLVGAEEVMEWGEMSDLIRNNDDVDDVMSGYNVYMLNNNGDMLPMSPVEYMRPSIIQMDLAVLRMQNVLAVTPPPGFKMDIDAFLDLNLGTGLQHVGPLKIAEMYQQTGRIYYSGTKMSGDAGNKDPLVALLSGYGNMLNDQIVVYNFEMDNLYSYLGLNKVQDGSKVPERIGAQVAQGQAEAGNLNIAHLYAGFVSIMTYTVKATGIMLWDALNSTGTNEMYIKLLGRENADFIRYNKEITKSNYLTRVVVNMAGEDLNWLYAMLATAVQQKALTPVDAMMVKKYAQFNWEFAVRYMYFMESKRAKDAQKAQQAQQQQQEQATAQLQAQQMQAKAAQEQASDKRAMIKETTKINGQHTLLIQQLINAALLEEQKEGKPIPSYVQLAINKQLQSHLLETEQQIQVMEEGLQQHDLEMMSQAQQQPKQQGQPEAA